MVPAFGGTAGGFGFARTVREEGAGLAIEAVGCRERCGEILLGLEEVAGVGGDRHCGLLRFGGV